jgi:hypothetical protein
VLACGIFAAILSAVEPTVDLKRERERFRFLTARAIGLFHSADSVTANQSAGGLSPSGSLTSERLIIERSLDRAEEAIEQRDKKAANKALDRVEGSLQRYARSLGGR